MKIYKDYKRIIGREVDEHNRTVYVIENLSGVEERVIYSEIDQSRVKDESKQELQSMTVVKNSSGERKVIKSHDEFGEKISQEHIRIEKDKFINPEKYAKKDIKA